MGPLTQPSGLQHHALFHDDDRTVASAAVSFVREGVEQGEWVFVAFDQHPVLPLLSAVFRGEPGVLFTPRDEGARPVRVLDQYQRTMDAGLRKGVRSFRAIGYLDLAGSDLDWAEWLRYEAAFAGLGDYPLCALCTWDTRTLTRQQTVAFRDAHPCLVEPGGQERRNEEYADPVELVSRPEHLPPPDPLQAGPPHYTAEADPDLRHLRVDIYPVALTSALPRRKIDDFVKAVGGVVLNAFTHGREPVRVRIWQGPDTLVCTVTDQGPGIDDPFVGYLRPAPASPRDPIPTGGYGLWAARQLCDTLDYASDDDGFTVRLVTRA